MSQIQFGFAIPAELSDKTRRQTFVEDLHRTLTLINGHFDSIWMIDHLPELLESFTTLSYMAALYPKLKFGHTVLCQSFRNPTLVANMGATLTAKYADWWNVSSTGINSYRHLIQEFERACLEVGRDPAWVKRSWCGGCICAHTRQAAQSIAGDRYNTDPDDDFDFVGTPEQIVEQMRPFIEMGIDYFMLDCGGFPDLTPLELLVSEVLPALNNSST